MLSSTCSKSSSEAPKGMTEKATMAGTNDRMTAVADALIQKVRKGA